MTNEELVTRIKGGEKDLMSALYTQNLRYIQIIARKLCADINDYEDAIQDAYFGLVAAVEAYDKDKGVKFMSFATYHIKLAIRRGKCTAQHIPEHILFRAARIRKAQTELSLHLGRTPTKAEISVKTDLTVEQIEFTLNAVMPVKSIYDPISEEDFTIADTIQDNSIDFENNIAATDEQQLLHDVVEGLPELEKTAIKLYFFRSMTYNQISKLLNITAGQARSLIDKGIRKLRYPKIKRKFLDDTL